jgi:DNA-binding SARP family transcriptional activator/CRP-like cAMP-binding protein
MPLKIAVPTSRSLLIRETQFTNNHEGRAMNLLKKTLFLGQIPLFAVLPSSGIKFLAKSLQQHDVPPDTILLGEGDPGDRFHIVMEGRLEIIKGLGTDEEKLLYVRGPGDFVGEMSFLIPSGLRTASVRTLTHARLLEMTRETFNRLLQRWPEVAVEMARALSLRLRDSDNARIQEMRRRRHEVSKALSDLQSTLSQVTESGAEPDFKRDRSLRLLSEFAEFQTALLVKDVVPDPRKKVQEVKRAIHRSTVPQIHVKTLGGFKLFRDETPVEESEWEANQPKLLLKAIIAHRTRGVPKDVLVEALWPEVAPLSGERNFKVILHRLRRTLEPELNKSFGSSYIHLKANLIYLDDELCHVDLDDFWSSLRQGEKKEEAGDMVSAISIYRQAVDLYCGDFLPEELYVSWVEAKRQELQTRYINLLFRVAELLEKRGNLKSATDYYRKVLQKDPTLELAYQRLMLNYSNRGMRNAAVKAYEDCTRVLRNELNTEPDSMTTSLFKKLSEST